MLCWWSSEKPKALLTGNQTYWSDLTQIWYANLLWGSSRLVDFRPRSTDLSLFPYRLNSFHAYAGKPPFRFNPNLAGKLIMVLPGTILFLSCSTEFPFVFWLLKFLRIWRQNADRISLNCCSKVPPMPSKLLFCNMEQMMSGSCNKMLTYAEMLHII